MILKKRELNFVYATASVIAVEGLSPPISIWPGHDSDYMTAEFEALCEGCKNEMHATVYALERPVDK